jgi:hypothetical protein
MTDTFLEGIELLRWPGVFVRVELATEKLTDARLGFCDATLATDSFLAWSEEASVDEGEIDDRAEALDGAAEGTAVGADDWDSEWSSLGGTGGAGLPEDKAGTLTVGPMLGDGLKVWDVGTSVLETTFRGRGALKSWTRVPRMGS